MIDKIFRYSMKAIIIKDGKLLVESCDYGRGRFMKLPGGGHKWGETMQQALIRECKEELNISVVPNQLVFTRDYIAKNHNTTIDEPCFHQAELMFICDVEDFTNLGNGVIPDDKQEIVWMDIDKLKNSTFMPKVIIPYLKNISNIKETICLGDVN